MPRIKQSKSNIGKPIGTTRTKRVTLEQEKSHRVERIGKDQSKHVSNPVSKTREDLIDILRGAAVLLMIITHVVAIAFNHEGSRVIYYIGLVGGIASFTTFLFLSGATSYLTFVGLDNSDRQSVKRRRVKIIKRAVEILLVYYILAMLSLYVYGQGFVSSNSEEFTKDFFRIILFLRVPPFTEFLLTLVAFSASLVVFRKVYKTIVSDFRFTLLTSCILYLSGYLLYNVELPDPKFNLAKAVIAGHEEIHTFPVLQYAPVFIFGLYIGRLLIKQTRKLRIKTLSAFSALLIALATASAYGYYEYEIEVFNISPFDARFPPSIGFILLSSSLTVSGLLILEIVKNNLRFLKRGLTFISVNALTFFFVHTFALLGFKYYKDTTTEPGTWFYSSILEILALYLGVIAICIILSHLQIKLSNFRSRKRLYLEARHYHYILRPVASLVILVIMLFAFYDNYLTGKTDLQVSGEVQREFTVEDNVDSWFDHGYKYRRAIKVEELTSDEIALSFSWVKVTLNHKEIVTNENLGETDGSDIRVVESLQSKITEIPIVISNPNSESTEVTFKYDTSSGKKYFLYYANDYSEVSSSPEDKTGIESAINVGLEDPQQHTLRAQINRKWFLKDFSETPQLTFIVTSEFNPEVFSSVSYKVEGTDLAGEMVLNEQNQYQVQLDVTGLEPGYYSIQTTAVELSNELKIYQTHKVPFYVSYPMYMSWSLDWEGWGVAQVDLDDIVGIANKYKMPITHYFNPRIYVKEQFSTFTIDENSAKYFTQWVYNRKLLGDEVGLHLHLYPDMLKEIGIEPRKDANIIGINRDESALHAYTQEELEKIINWSLQKFQENGLGRPVSFRSGAWMSGTNVLFALYNTGFAVDSSGRTGGILNPSWPGSTAIPWNLSETTKPYMPSIYNINSWEGERIGIWEFPNNGADSYWFTVDDLKKRFDLNYPEKYEVVTRPQALTVLSHPHGFTIYDSAKVKGLLDYTGNYLYNSDRGPVVYTTIEGAYLNWNKDFINGE